MTDDPEVKFKGDETATDIPLSERLPDRFEIHGELGAGAMGTVYRAFDRDLDTEVAIKVLNPEFSVTAEQQQRFAREARMLASVKHPNILHIKYMGLTDDGTAYQVAELLVGETLAERLQRRRLHTREFKTVFLQVANGLEFAREQGVVHRDIKPSNIFIEELENKLVVKILDFGIARYVEAKPGEQTLTGTSAIAGSPLYMSPEQCRSEKLDFRSDIYSLGCVMYECIAGRPPFSGENAIETMYLHISKDPEPLNMSDEGIRQISELTMKCLAKSPDARTQSFQEIIEVLERIPENQSDSLGLSRSVNPAVEKADALKWLKLAALILVATIVAVPAFDALQKRANRQTPQQARARLLKSLAESEQKIDATPARTAAETIEYQNKIFAMGEQYTRYQDFKSAVRCYKKFLGAGNEYTTTPLERAVARKSLGYALMHTREPENIKEAEQELKQAIAIFDDLHFTLSQPQHLFQSLDGKVAARVYLAAVYASYGDISKAHEKCKESKVLLAEIKRILASEQRFFGRFKAESAFDRIQTLKNFARPKDAAGRVELSSIFLWSAEFMMGEYPKDRRTRRVLDWCKAELDQAPPDTPGWKEAEARYRQDVARLDSILRSPKNEQN